MKNPENVLISLIKHSNKKDYKYERLYRLLYNEEMYLIAYQNIYSNDGSMTKGTDHITVDGMSMEEYKKSYFRSKMKAISLILQEERIYQRKTEKCVRLVFRLLMINYFRK